jgi:hypothetical protein
MTTSSHPADGDGQTKLEPAGPDEAGSAKRAIRRVARVTPGAGDLSGFRFIILQSDSDGVAHQADAEATER